MADREKLIEAVSSFNFLIESGGCAIGEYIVPYSIQEPLADHLIANDVTIQKWIPVAEKLPEKITNKVLVYCKNGYIGFGHYEDFQGVKDWYNLENGKPFREWDLEDCETYEVTHWCELPEPPKGE